MKKVLLLITLALFSILSFNHAAIAGNKPYLSQVKQIKAWPTDVLVENYSGQSVTVRFITTVSDNTVKIDPYPASNYFAQLLHQVYAYQVRVILWDSYGHLFFDENVGNVKRITLTRGVGGKQLSAKNVIIESIK